MIAEMLSRMFATRMENVFKKYSKKENSGIVLKN